MSRPDTQPVLCDASMDSRFRGNDGERGFASFRVFVIPAKAGIQYALNRTPGFLVRLAARAALRAFNALRAVVRVSATPYPE